MRVGTVGRTIVALLVAVVVTGGCDRSESVKDVERIKIRIAELRSQPSLEETEQQMNDIVRQITEAATAIVPTMSWATNKNRERSQGTCGQEYRDTGGLNVFLPQIGAGQAIPEKNWPEVLQSAREIARQAGITEMQVLADVPGNRDIRLYGENGNAIMIGYLTASVISARTGCRLPATDLAQPPS
jgi:hypothetical protein